MNKSLFCKEFNLIIRNKVFIFIVILLIFFVIYGQYNQLNSTANFIEQTNTYMQTHTKSDNGFAVDNSNLKNSILNAYQILRPKYILNNILLLLSAILPLLFVIISSIEVGEEFSNRTLPVKATYWGWQHVVFIKSMLLATLIFVITILLAIIGAIVGLANWQYIAHQPQAAESLSIKPIQYSIIKQILLIELLTLVYAEFGMLITMITKKTFVGCLTPLFFMYFVEAKIPYSYLPSKLGATIMNTSFVTFPLSFFTPTQAATNIPDSSCYLVLFLYFIIFLYLCLLYSKKQIIAQR